MITDDCQTCGHPLTVNWAECEECGEAVSTDKFAAIVDTHEQLVNANTRQAAELLIRDQDLERERKEHQRTRRALRMMQENNLWQCQKFERIETLCGTWTEDDDAPLPGPVRQCGEALSDLLHDCSNGPALPYPDAVHARFHFRDPEREDGQGSDFFPGDGFGFVGATHAKLSVMFECGGVVACADLTYEQLRPLLAKEGLALVSLGEVPVSPLVAGTSAGGLIGNLRTRIAQLEKQLDWAKRAVEVGDEIAAELRAKLDEQEKAKPATAGYWAEGATNSKGKPNV